MSWETDWLSWSHGQYSSYLYGMSSAVIQFCRSALQALWGLGQVTVKHFVTRVFVFLGDSRHHIPSINSAAGGLQRRRPVLHSWLWRRERQGRWRRQGTEDSGWPTYHKMLVRVVRCSSTRLCSLNLYWHFSHLAGAPEWPISKVTTSKNYYYL